MAISIGQEIEKLSAFARAYCECALWLMTDDKGELLDKNYVLEDIPWHVMRRMRRDCQIFQITSAWEEHGSIGGDEQGGHDFWLTRNGHGAGFWDGDWKDQNGSKMPGEELTAAAKMFGEFNLVLNDDGSIGYFDS